MTLRQTFIGSITLGLLVASTFFLPAGAAPKQGLAVTCQNFALGVEPQLHDLALSVCIEANTPPVFGPMTNRATKSSRFNLDAVIQLWDQWGYDTIAISVDGAQFGPEDDWYHRLILRKR